MWYEHEMDVMSQSRGSECAVHLKTNTPSTLGRIDAHVITDRFEQSLLTMSNLPIRCFITIFSSSNRTNCVTSESLYIVRSERSFSMCLSQRQDSQLIWHIQTIPQIICYINENSCHKQQGIGNEKSRLFWKVEVVFVSSFVSEAFTPEVVYPVDYTWVHSD